MSDAQLLQEISRKLSALIALSFREANEKLTTGDRIKLLARLGLSNQEVADILGTTKGTVEVLKSRKLKSEK